MTKWTDEEDQVLKDVYLKEWDEIVDHLPDRSKRSIQHRMVRLDLRRPRSVLSDEDKRYIEEQIYYKTANEIARDLDVSKTTIHRFLDSNGIKLQSHDWILDELSVSNDSIFSIEAVYVMDLKGEFRDADE